MVVIKVMNLHETPARVEGFIRIAPDGVRFLGRTGMALSFSNVFGTDATECQLSLETLCVASGQRQMEYEVARQATKYLAHFAPKYVSGSLRGKPTHSFVHWQPPEPRPNVRRKAA